MMTTLRMPKRQQSLFLGQYKLERRALIRAEKARGIPGLRSGTDADGNPVLIKIWPRDQTVNDEDLQEIWRHETRELHRLAGFPGASDYIAELRTSGFDEQGYYLVISPGQRIPLEKYLTESAQKPWPTAKSISGRSLAWANLLRLAKGIEILHLQGLLHRNLSTWSILTANQGEADFQLTGFEWSMRIVGQEIPAKMKSHNLTTDGRHSFTRDWIHLGEIAVKLLEIQKRKITDISLASHEVSEHLTADEIRLVRQLLQIFKTDRMDGRIVTDQIEKILTALNTIQQKQELIFKLVLPLGSNAPLATPIREASDRTIETNDIEGQKQFIENDLINPIAISVKNASNPEQFYLLLRGERLTYRLDDFRTGKDKIPSNWNFAYCSSADTKAPLSQNVINTIPMSAGALMFIPLQEAHKTSRFKARTNSWNALRQQLKNHENSLTPERLLRKSLVLAQMLDYVFAASDIFPVEAHYLLDDLEEDSGGKIKLCIRPRNDEKREALSKALGLKDPPAKRLAEYLMGDVNKNERNANWTLTDSPMLGDRTETTTEWQFESEKKSTTGEQYYVFSGDRHAAIEGNLFLIPAESTGRDAQFRRRMKSFAALGEHRELSNMLSDPRNRILNSHDKVIHDHEFNELDSSKKSAFKAAVETLPLFLVQGPPGVGKTRLVRELIRQTLLNDKSTRLLLSAQSNAAVDHLLNEVENVLSKIGIENYLVVRCTSRERDVETAFDIGKQTKLMLSKLAKSSLLSETSSDLIERVRRLTESYEQKIISKNTMGTPQPTIAARRAIESLVLRSANLVFATTNSSELERLIEETSQFDWAIVEEAAKATGGELISPLLLSPRRLMIGDHKQLPPFGAERILKLLESPKQVKKALSIGDRMIGNRLRDPVVEDVFNDIDEDGDGAEAKAEAEAEAEETDNFSFLCSEAIKNFSLFESMIEVEFERQKRNSSGKPIAAALHKQHRMHPIISNIVSTCFYKNTLETDPDCAEGFLNKPCPIRSRDLDRLPDSPIVWIDVPWVQNTIKMKYGEQKPRYVNIDEQKAIIAALELIDINPAANKTPSLAILSAYSKQVQELSRLVEQGLQSNLKNLHRFSNASKQKNFCNTVDSFQGNEADCVLVSLVRNNNHGSIYRSLGFLADSRRMNVLLSRAKWRLVIVGSLSFLDNVYQRPKSDYDRSQIDFLQHFLEKIQQGNQETGISVIPLSKLLGKRL